MWQIIGVLAELERSPSTERTRAGVKASSAGSSSAAGQNSPFPRSLTPSSSSTAVSACVGRKDAAARITAWSKNAIDPGDRGRFAEIVETGLIGLHEGNFARYRIRPSEFASWRQVWEAR